MADAQSIVRGAEGALYTEALKIHQLRERVIFERIPLDFSGLKKTIL